MRLRRVTMRGLGMDVEMDFRGARGEYQQITGIIGGNGSGKTTLVESIGATLRRGSYLRKEVERVVEFDIDGEIHSSVIREGAVVQGISKGFFSWRGFTVEGRPVRDALLVYDSLVRVSHCARNYSTAPMAVGLVAQVLQDFYKWDIQNSVVVIDDLEMGLSDSSAREFLQALIRKVLEKDNQLIVTTRRESCLSLIPVESWRRLGEGTKVVEEAIKTLKKP
jgi:predicted ATPase